MNKSYYEATKKMYKKMLLIEDRLNYTFPSDLRKIYTDEASSINFFWEDTQKVFGASCNFGEFNLLSPAQIEKY
ncbi:MAG: hypothetical protein JXN65_02105 [Clostridia bacterium]|nr:hypothetical protein [Clostridia bacterium]